MVFGNEITIGSDTQNKLCLALHYCIVNSTTSWLFGAGVIFLCWWISSCIVLKNILVVSKKVTVVAYLHGDFFISVCIGFSLCSQVLEMDLDFSAFTLSVWLGDC